MSEKLPPEWEKRSLSDLANYFNGRAFKPNEWVSKGLPIIRIQQINNPTDLVDFYDGADVEEKHRVRRHDLLFSWSATLKAVIWKHQDGVLNQHIFKVIEKEGVDRKFLQSIIEFNIDHLAENSHGSTMKHIRKGVLSEYEVAVPRYAEQKKIAEILTTVDEVIENTETEINKLEDLKKATMNELLTKGIGHTEFKETEIGRIPKSWEVMTLQQLCVLQRGHDLPTQNRVDGNVPIYGSNGIVGFHSTTDIEPNGVVTGRSGSIGDVYFVSGRYWPLNTTLYVVDFRGNDRRFVRMFLQHFRLERFATGTGVPTLNRNDLHPLRIRVPPIQEQAEIVSIVGAIEAQLDAMHRSLESKKYIRNALLSDLLTGKVRVKVN